MKVIVECMSGFGGSKALVYEYTKKHYIDMIKDNLQSWREEIENVDEIEEWIEDSQNNKGEPGSIRIITADDVYEYTVCEVNNTEAEGR